MEVFKGLAQDEGICIANTESVFGNADDSKYDEAVRSLQQFKATAKVSKSFSFLPLLLVPSPASSGALLLDWLSL
jgi:hypothetical protein